MGRNKILNAVIIFIIISISISCNKSDDDNSDPTNNNNTEQGLIFYLKDSLDSPVSFATVGVSYTIMEAINNTYLETKISDSDGKVVFNNIPDAGDYYYKINHAGGEQIQLFTYNGGNQTINIQL